MKHLRKYAVNVTDEYGTTHPIFVPTCGQTEANPTLVHDPAEVDCAECVAIQVSRRMARQYPSMFTADKRPLSGLFDKAKQIEKQYRQGRMETKRLDWFKP